MSNPNSPRQGFRTTLSDRHFSQAELEALASQGKVLDFDGCSFVGTRFDKLRVANWHFYGCDFDAVSFAGAHLSDVRWFACQARHASFRGAQLARARFKDCGFAMTDWDESMLADAVFDAVDLRDAWFADATLQDVAMFESGGADLARARIETTPSHATRQQESDVIEEQPTRRAVMGFGSRHRACYFQRLGGNAV